MSEFNEKDFQIAVDALNEYLKGKEKDEISIEGLSIEDQVGVFLGPVTEAIDTGVAGELPAEVIDFYNNQLVDEDDSDEADEEQSEETEVKSKKGKKGKKEKKEKKEKKPRAPRNVERDAFGYTVGTGAARINSLIANGQFKSMKDLIEEVGTTRSRVTSHFNSLKSKGFFIDNIDGHYTLMTTEPPEKPEKPKKEKKAKKEKKEKKAKEEVSKEETTEETPKEETTEEAPKEETATEEAPAKKKSKKKGK